MHPYILLGKILQRFSDKKSFHLKGYNRFVYVGETDKSVKVLREKGTKAIVPFQKILTGIEAYQSDPGLYDLGPVVLRDFGITHVNSPVWTLLHLLKKEEYG